MRRKVQRRTAAGLFALLALLAPAAVPATASPPARNNVIVLDGATSAEGIAAGRGTTFYAGDRLKGDIYRGDIRGEKATLFIDAPAGRQAVGMKADVRKDLLFVAGGSTGKAFVYNTTTGKPVEEVKLNEGFINDVTLTRGGAWFTNSKAAELYFLPVDRHGKLGKTQSLPLEGPAAELPADFNLNGIAAVKRGNILIVAHSAKGALMTVDPGTGKSELIENVKVPNVDGILVRGKTVWAVQNQLNQISRIRLSHDLSSGEIRDTITSPDFNIPTTAALFGNTLAAVNAQFGKPPSPHEVVLVPARQHGHHHDH
jgi:hypothetical protein